MRRALSIIFKILVTIILTLLTQIGGVIYLLSEWIMVRVGWRKGYVRICSFIVFYLIISLWMVPPLASLFGRERVMHSKNIRPATYLTVILNRNYVRPEMNDLLERVTIRLDNSEIQVRFLDANFPFLNRFPLLPHLSHNDGKKLDLGLVYEDESGKISTQQKSNTGYGVFEGPSHVEVNQIESCFEQGYFQYDLAKYFTLGTKNSSLSFSEKGTRNLISIILDQPELGKMFIEPHLKQRLQLTDSKIRYHGCRAVRHDDHIHIQIK